MSFDSRLLNLLLRYEDLQQRGQAITPEELCRDCPELLEEVQRQLHGLKALQPLLGATVPEETPAERTHRGREQASAPSHETAPSGLRYRPSRKHAEGGLGEVWVAEDDELHRQVALKRIRQERRDDPDCRRRFVLEAEVTARLEHPGVVPVHGLVRDEQGHLCYAMRFVQGATLHDALQAFHEADQPGRDPGERSLALRQLLTHFVAVCNTLAYAHSRGILHRDIKPGNIMLGRYGETLVVDWGLAKPFARDEPARSAGEATRTPTVGTGPSGTALGQAIGTPAYMSPEQAEGRWDVLGPASDIYSLGATLYALLTGQAPFQGGAVGGILHRVRKGEFAPPRQVKRGTPPALEAICLKAMARQPEQRYTTALELAKDVERWLADEPVSAYHEPWTARWRRWLRHHRTLTASGLAALVFALGSLAVITAVLTASNKALEAAHASERLARDEATEGRNQARRNFRFARQTVADYTAKVGANLRLREEDLRELRRDLLQLAMRFHEEFKDQIGDDVEMQADRADALYQLGLLANQIGTLPEAVAHFEAAARGWEPLAGALPAEPRYPRQLALCYRQLAELYRRTGQIPKAKEHSQRALDMQEELVRAHPGEADFQSDLARSLYHQAVLTFYNSEPGPAEEAFQRSLRVWRALLEEHPDNEVYRSGLAEASYELAYLYHRAKRLDQSEELYLQALHLQQQLVQEHPGNSAHQMALSDTYDGLGPLYRDRGQLDQVEGVLHEALRIRRQLVEAHPSVTLYKRNLGGSYNNLANWYARNDLPQKVKEFRAQALRIQQQLTAAHPSDLGLQRNLGQGLLTLAQDLVAAGEAEEGRSRSLEAAEILRAVLVKGPKEREAGLCLSHALHVLADADSRLGRHPEALAAWKEGMAYVDDQARDSYRMLHAVLLVRSGQHATAAAEVDELVRSCEAPLLLYDAVEVYAATVTMVAQDANLAPDRRQELADRYGARAVKLLGQLHGTGYFQDARRVNKLRTSKELQVLLPREEFRRLLAELDAARAGTK